MWDASHSWLIGDQRPLARALAFAAAALLMLAGIALWTHGGWWRRRRPWRVDRPAAPLFHPVVPDHLAGQHRADRRHRVHGLAAKTIVGA